MTVFADEAVRFQAELLDAAGQAIIAIDMAGVVVYWNMAAEAMYGWSNSDAVGRPVHDLITWDETTERADSILASMRRGQSWSGDCWVRRRDGTRFPVYITDTPVLDEDGRLTAIIGVAADMTERRAGENALRQLAAIVAGSGDAIFGVSTEGVVTSWNAAAEGLFGYSAAEIIGQPVSVIAPKERVAEQSESRARLNAGGAAEHLETVRRCKDGSLVDVLMTVSSVPGEVGDVAGLAVIAHDITERCRAQRALAMSETRFEIGFEQSAIGAVIADLHGIPIRVNPAVCALLGRPAHLLAGHRWMEFTHPDDVPLGQAVLARVADGHDTYDDERRYLRPDGTTVWASAHVVLVRDELARPQYFFVQLQDITEGKQMQQQLAHQALHDSLTGLPNRELLIDRLMHGLAGSRRRGSHVGVIFLDVDRLKSVNDSFGHDSGDHVIKCTAERIAGAIRPGDTVARFGGDEFVIVCDDVSALETQVIAERVLEAVSHPCAIGDQERIVTASLGFVVADAESTPESLLRDADVAMYRAKRRGRGRIEPFDEALRSKAEQRSATAAALNRALERDELDVHYQPIVDLTTGAMVSAEALLRWRHPERGLVSPDEFIPLAEETGLIIPMGAWVLEQACHQLAQWQRTDPLMSIAVNLSVRQLVAPDIAAVIAAVLRRTGARPEGLCLELTESVFMEDVEYFERALTSLKALGVRLAIDDFGTGYSSLGYLKRFPFDAVKVDREFTDGLGTDPHDSALVAAVVAMAGAFELEVTAEGVETEEQLTALKALHCGRAQGFYLARPMPAAELTRLVATSHRWAVDGFTRQQHDNRSLVRSTSR